jgi:hypothetical protein
MGLIHLYALQFPSEPSWADGRLDLLKKTARKRDTSFIGSRYLTSDFNPTSCKVGGSMLRHHEISVIYKKGSEAVTETIRHLYEMIEVEDERVH